MSRYSQRSGPKPVAHSVLFMWHTTHKFLLSSSCSCLMECVSRETEPRPWAAGGLGWHSVLRSRLILSWSFILLFSTAASIDRNIYDVWLRGHNGVREHSGADWKGRGKCALKPWIFLFFCSQKPAIALILGTWGMLHFNETPPWI